MKRHGWAYALATLATLQFAGGFDIWLVGKIAPVLASFYHQPVRALGAVFVAHQLGLAFGAAVGGACADRFGRKPVLLTSAVMAGLATLALPAATTLTWFAILRAVSGAFLGAAGPAVLAFAVGLASVRWRGPAVTTVLACYSLGSAAGSVFTLVMLDRYGWQTAFSAAGWLLVVLALPVLLCLPASNEVIAREEPQTTGLWDSGARGHTLALAACFVFSLGLVSLLSSWMPSFFHDRAHIPVQRFAAVGVLYAPAAVLGMLASGWLSTRFRFARIVIAMSATQAASVALLGILSFQSASFPFAYFTSIFAQTGGQGLLNIAVARVFRGPVRATAFGVMAAVGRCGGVLTPWLGAWAIDTRLPLGTIFAVAAIIPLVVGVILVRASATGHQHPGYSS